MAALRLSAFLAGVASREHGFGRLDCLLFLADWFAACRGADPAAAFRGRYATARGAALILRRAGGMVALVDRCVTPLGLRRTDRPASGDIAVVAAPEGEMGAIALGPPLLASLGVRGLYIRPVPVVAAWGIG